MPGNDFKTGVAGVPCKGLLIPLIVLSIGAITFGTSSARPVAISCEEAQTLQLAEAEKFWNLAIEAKGGRARLYSVDDLQMSVSQRSWSTFRRLTLIQENLYVFPSKSWEWDDQRGTVFGFSIRLHNFEKDNHVSYVDAGKGGRIVPILNPSRNNLTHLQLHLLMETKWVKPVPVRLRHGRVKGRPADIVETMVPELSVYEKRVEFALDPKTHLPFEVIYYGVNHGREYSGGVSLSDYVDVNGIQMPSRIGGIQGSYRINVEFDESVFEQPPRASAGKDAWKGK